MNNNKRPTRRWERNGRPERFTVEEVAELAGRSMGLVHYHYSLGRIPKPYFGFTVEEKDTIVKYFAELDRKAESETAT